MDPAATLPHQGKAKNQKSCATRLRQHEGTERNPLANFRHRNVQKLVITAKPPFIWVKTLASNGRIPPVRPAENTVAGTHQIQVSNLIDNGDIGTVNLLQKILNISGMENATTGPACKHE